MSDSTMLDAHLIGQGPVVPDRTADGIRAARETWTAVQLEHGLRGNARLIGANGKLAKGEGITVGVTLTPAAAHGRWNTCQHATDDCRAACILDHGQSAFSNVRRTREAKTAFLADHPSDFVTVLADEILTTDGQPRTRKGLPIGAVRLNVASDLRWEVFAPDLLATLAAAGIRAYDYSKYPPSARQLAPSTYRVVLSYHGTNLRHCLRYLADGGTVAVVFASPRHALPDRWHGFPVIDGDVADDRTTDPRGVVVGLAAKGDLVGQDGTADGFLQDPHAHAAAIRPAAAVTPARIAALHGALGGRVEVIAVA